MMWKCGAGVPVVGSNSSSMLPQRASTGGPRPNRRLARQPRLGARDRLHLAARDPVDGRALARARVANADEDASPFGLARLRLDGARVAQRGGGDAALASSRTGERSPRGDSEDGRALRRCNG